MSNVECEMGNVRALAYLSCPIFAIRHSPFAIISFPMTRPKGFTLLMLIFPLVWAGSFIAGKWALRDFSPEITSLLRFTMASAVLFPFAFKKPAAPGAWAPRNLAVVFLLGLTGMFAYHVLFYYSLKYTSAGNSSLIISTDSLITVILAVIFLKERLTWRKGLGIGLGFAGVVWVVSEGALGQLLTRGPNLGDLLAFGAALSWGVYSVLSKPIAHTFPTFDLSLLTYVVGAVLLAPWLSPRAPWPASPTGPPRAGRAWPTWRSSPPE